MSDMVVVFAEQGEYDDYTVVVFGLAKAEDAEAAAKHYALQLAKQRGEDSGIKRDVQPYEYAVRQIRPEEVACRRTLLTRRTGSLWENIETKDVFPSGAWVLQERYTEAYCRSLGWDCNKVNKELPANAYDWCVLWKPVELFEREAA